METCLRSLVTGTVVAIEGGSSELMYDDMFNDNIAIDVQGVLDIAVKNKCDVQILFKMTKNTVMIDIDHVLIQLGKVVRVILDTSQVNQACSEILSVGDFEVVTCTKLEITPIVEGVILVQCTPTKY